MNALVELLRKQGLTAREGCARGLGVSLREVRALAEESRLHAEKWEDVVMSTLDGLRLPKEYGELVDEAARIRSQHLRALKQCENMERLARDAKQGILPMVALMLMVIPYWMLG